MPFIKGLMQVAAPWPEQVWRSMPATVRPLMLSRMAQGNLILTDANYQILTLLRSHRDDAKGLATMAAHAYPIHSIRLRAQLAPEQLAAALNAADEKATLRGV